jgi:hypothetical protein
MSEIRREQFDDGVYTETSRRKLAYTHEFKGFMAENPGIFNAVRKLIDELEKGEGEYASQGYDYEYVNDVEVEVFHLDQKAPWYNDLYKVLVDGQAFFIKKGALTKGGDIYGPKASVNDGAVEWLSAEKAKEMLKDLPWVEVVDYKLGYTRKSDKEGPGEGYFVSKFYPASCIALDDYIKDLRRKINQKKSEASETASLHLENLQEKISVLQEKLWDFFDVREGNMLYNPEEDKIIIFDLSEYEEN